MRWIYEGSMAEQLNALAVVHKYQEELIKKETTVGSYAWVRRQEKRVIEGLPREYPILVARRCEAEVDFLCSMTALLQDDSDAAVTMPGGIAETFNCE